MVARWSKAFVCAAVFQVAFGASVATGDGLPVLGAEANGHQGVRSLGGTLSYVTRRAGPDTRVQQRSRLGRVIFARRLAGRLVVPVVAYDGTASGLSADGRTLVLIRPRVSFPRASTSLVVLATRGLQVRSRLRLHGDFSFDAIGPDGRRIYLIQYTSAADPTRYRVRVLDVESGRLVSGAIVDPHDRSEAMHGAPVTRITSRDGRWAYTLYDGNGHPFVHALDTSSASARCIDLPAHLDAWSARLRLSPSGTELLVQAHQRTVAMIDTATLSVRRPAAGTQKPSLPRNAGAGLGALPLIPGVIAIVSVAVVITRRRYARPVSPVQTP